MRVVLDTLAVGDVIRMERTRWASEGVWRDQIEMRAGKVYVHPAASCGFEFGHEGRQM